MELKAFHEAYIGESLFCSHNLDFKSPFQDMEVEGYVIAIILNGFLTISSEKKITPYIFQKSFACGKSRV